METESYESATEVKMIGVVVERCAVTNVVQGETVGYEGDSPYTKSLLEDGMLKYPRS